MTHLYKILLAISLFLGLINCEKIEPYTDYRQDVTPIRIIEEKLFLSGTTTLNDYSSRISRTIKLPPKTKYWVLWVGVGQESIDKLKAATTEIPKAAQSIIKNPLYRLRTQYFSILTHNKWKRQHKFLFHRFNQCRKILERRIFPLFHIHTRRTNR